MKLKRVGFFRELSHGDKSGQSLKESIRNYSSEDEDKIIAYLENGVVFCVSAGLFSDVLDESKGRINNLEILTDGVWQWPSDLAYYVKLYHVELDADFMEHIRRNEWVIPNEKDIDLLKLVEKEADEYTDIVYNRSFKLWYYTVSHQQLLLRSLGKDGNYNVDIYFYAVDYIEIPWNINTLQIIDTTQEDIDYINNKFEKTDKKITVLTSCNKKYYVVSSGMKIYKNNLSMFEVPFDIPNDMGGFHTTHARIEY